MKKTVWIALAIVGAWACNNEATVVETSPEAEQMADEVFGTESESPSLAHPDDLSDGHVKVLEQMDTDRYTYLRVSEADGREYWIATAKAVFEVGGEYHYHEGIYKTDYYSTFFDKTFEEIYLVSKIHGVNESSTIDVVETTPRQDVNATEDVIREGSIRIAKLVNDASSFNGQTIQVSGKVIKVNPMIMGRNWIHLQDGSMNSYDFVVTTNEAIPVGHTVTLKGVLKTDQDFGSGYSYDVIVEDAELIRE